MIECCQGEALRDGTEYARCFGCCAEDDSGKGHGDKAERSLSRSMAAFRGDSQQLLRATLEPTAGCCSGFVNLLKGRRLGDRKLPLVYPGENFPGQTRSQTCTVTGLKGFPERRCCPLLPPELNNPLFSTPNSMQEHCFLFTWSFAMFAVLETPTTRKGEQKVKLPWQWVFQIPEKGKANASSSFHTLSFRDKLHSSSRAIHTRTKSGKRRNKRCELRNAFFACSLLYAFIPVCRLLREQLRQEQWEPRVREVSRTRKEVKSFAKQQWALGSATSSCAEQTRGQGADPPRHSLSPSQLKEGVPGFGTWFLDPALRRRLRALCSSEQLASWVLDLADNGQAKRPRQQLKGCGLALAQSWCLCPANVLSCCQYRGGIARYFWEGCCWQGRGGNGRGRGKAAEIARFSSRKGAKNNNIWERGGKAPFAVRTEVSWCCWGLCPETKRPKELNAMGETRCECRQVSVRELRDGALRGCGIGQMLPRQLLQLCPGLFRVMCKCEKACTQSRKGHRDPGFPPILLFPRRLLFHVVQA
ncbi:hypothetical protein Anapl_16401 [Anas platyrhynchos]|uniref:Uncharacterized protein n=1 Tax=Anas platyrhynchos TaxID=8839 RepID=R0L1Q1_ANAPL|nr:hypothetical protein Anapl_16401 [Anas platyrhynchos]